MTVAPAGSLLAFNSLTWHGGGPNRTDHLRRAFHVHYCRSWVRPQRDHPRSIDPESLRDASPLLVRLLGYHSQMEFEPELNDHQRLVALLRHYREKAGLRQVELAERLGRPQSFVSKYESGQRRLDVVELKAICDAVGVSTVALVRRWEGGRN